jgi:hypothetical protein
MKGMWNEAVDAVIYRSNVELNSISLLLGGTRWKWHRNVVGSIPDGVTGFFHWHNRFGRTMAMESTQPQRRADNLTTFMCRLSRNQGASTSWNPKGLSRPVMGLLYVDRVCCTMSNVELKSTLFLVCFMLVSPNFLPYRPNGWFWYSKIRGSRQ